MPSVAPCPDPETLKRFLNGALEPAQHHAVDAHAHECAACVERLNQLALEGPLGQVRLGIPELSAVQDMPAEEVEKVIHVALAPPTAAPPTVAQKKPHVSPTS